MTEYVFMKRLARILNSGQSRAVILSGEIHDLFAVERDGAATYTSLLEMLRLKWGGLKGRILITFELNGPISFMDDAEKERVREAWMRHRTGLSADAIAIKQVVEVDQVTKRELAEQAKGFEKYLRESYGNPTLALEFLRQLCIVSRARAGDGSPILKDDLIVVIEGAHLMVPPGEIARLAEADRHRIYILRDWFEDREFMEGGDSVVLLAESRSMLNREVARLPQLMQVEISPPSLEERSSFLDWFEAKHGKVELWETKEAFAKLTAGLSMHALLQLLLGAKHTGARLEVGDVVEKVEEYLLGQLGDDTIEFKKPEHRMADVVGFTRLKKFLMDEVAPRFRATGSEALPGAAVGGPIGAGKTFIFEALAAELGMVVLVLKNLRSKWFGETDIIFERLRRTLEAMVNVLIIVDEADTQFGGVGADTHETERRLTGKIQAMMSDTRLRGKVRWLLMTARIHLLSPDIRRPGRVGDLIIPVLDPTGDDRKEFVKWMAAGAMDGELDAENIGFLEKETAEYSAAGFASVRSELRARTKLLGRKMTLDEVLDTVSDIIPPAIGKTRRYQELQALVNCTRWSLLPEGPEDSKSEDRERWFREIQELEAEGVS